MRARRKIFRHYGGFNVQIGHLLTRLFDRRRLFRRAFRTRASLTM